MIAIRRDTLIENIFLCTRAARDLLRVGVELNDLVQIAAVGLVKAADRFNTARHAFCEDAYCTHAG